MIKKAVLIITLLLVSSHLCAVFGQPLDEATKNRMRAIVAIELNYISLKDKPGMIKALNIIDNDELDIAKITDVVKSQTKNVELIGHIKAIPIADGATPEVIVQSFVDEVFKSEPVKVFFKNPGRNIDDTKKKVENRLNQLIATDCEELSIEPSDDDSNSPKNASEAKDKKSAKNAVENSDAKDANAESGRGGFSSLFLILIIILLVGGCAYFFITLRKETEELRLTKIKLKKALKDRDELQTQLTNANNDNIRLKQEKEQIDQEVCRLLDEIKRLNSSGPYAQSSASQGRGYGRNFAPNAAVPNEPKVYMGPKKLYAQMVNNGIFDNVQSRYDASESMYMIATDDGLNGKFSFIDDANAVVIAQNARDMFIESACKIINDEVREFNHIITITPGSVVNTQNGWKITQKAQVRLA